MTGYLNLNALIITISCYLFLIGPIVEKIVLDFEKGAWKALAKVFPAARLQGCAFHFSQALIRRIGHEGLSRAYMTDPGTRSILKRILALCYIPATWIPSMFKQLETKCTTPNLIAFAVYVRSTWIDNEKYWPPAAWSVFHMSTRTNNDLEGWHRQFNGIAKRNMPFYLLIEKMFDVSNFVEIQINLIREDKLTRRQTTKYAGINKQLCQYWEEYDAGTLAVTELLKKCAALYTPVIP